MQQPECDGSVRCSALASQALIPWYGDALGPRIQRHTLQPEIEFLKAPSAADNLSLVQAIMQRGLKRLRQPSEPPAASVPARGILDSFVPASPLVAARGESNSGSSSGGADIEENLHTNLVTDRDIRGLLPPEAPSGSADLRPEEVAAQDGDRGQGPLLGHPTIFTRMPGNDDVVEVSDTPLRHPDVAGRTSAQAAQQSAPSGDLGDHREANGEASQSEHSAGALLVVPCSSPFGADVVPATPMGPLSGASPTTLHSALSPTSAAATAAAVDAADAADADLCQHGDGINMPQRGGGWGEGVQGQAVGVPPHAATRGSGWELHLAGISIEAVFTCSSGSTGKSHCVSLTAHWLIVGCRLCLGLELCLL